MNKLQKILYWALVVFTVYIIIEILRKIFGGSLGFEELVSTLLVINIGYSFHLNSKISNINIQINSKMAELDSKLSEHIGWHKGKNN